MRGLAGSLPTTAWLLALPQLISRICHSLSDVQQNVQSILVRLAEDFPQQVGLTDPARGPPWICNTIIAPEPV